MAAELRTARGPYRVVLISPPESAPRELVLTLALERTDGIERVVLRCRVAHDLIVGGPNELLGLLAPWLEREFERTREAALKSIRTERKLLDLRFDREWPGPFATAC